MVVTRNGATGVRVASHVMEDISVAPVHAPVRCQRMEDVAAGDWDDPQNYKDVTLTSAQVIVYYLFLLVCKDL